MLYSILIIGMGLFFFWMGLRNVLFMRKATRKPKIFKGPKVSILVPARNEESRITPCLEGLKQQNYADYEVLLLDDRSTDGTRALMDSTVKDNPRFKVIEGTPIPEDWNGKPWALSQLAAEANGDILIFLDADMMPEPDLIAWTVTNLTEHQADSLSGYARHPLRNFGEALIAPVFYMPTMNIVRLWKVMKNTNPKDSHAIGQIFAYRREAYDKVGGYDAVRNKINEDVCMARLMKQKGFRHAFLDAKDVLSGELYGSFGEAVRGLRRIQLEYFDGSALNLSLIIVLLGGLILSPPFLAIFDIIRGRPVPFGIWVGMITFLAAWATVLWDRKQKWYVPFLYPIQFTVMAWVCLSSIINGFSGRGYIWKDRIVTLSRSGDG